MYRTVETGVWDDPKFEPLVMEAKLLFFYLFTNRHAHVSGIYPMKPAMASIEMMMPEEALRPAWDRLEVDGLIQTDRLRNIVWVVNMLRHQGRGEKNERSAARQLETLHGSPLIAGYVRRYPEVSNYLRLDRVSIGYPALADTLSGVGSQKEEQEQDKEKEPEAGAGGAPGSALADPPPAARPLMTFPCIAGKKTATNVWALTAEQVAEWERVYPDMDILGEAGKALAWAKSHSLKTHDGMPAFLVGWFNRGQNGGRYMKRVAQAPVRARAAEEREAYEELAAAPSDQPGVLAALQGKLRKLINPDEYSTWIAPLLLRRHDDRSVLVAPSQRYVYTLTDAYGSQMAAAAEACGLPPLEIITASAALAAGGTK